MTLREWVVVLHWVIRTVEDDKAEIFLGKEETDRRLPYPNSGPAP